MSASIGNLFTSMVNAVIQRPGEPPLLEGAAYFLFFAGLMAAAAALFIPVAQRFRDQRVLQESE
jgi:hypothetical protein